MQSIPILNGEFIEQHTNFLELVYRLEWEFGHTKLEVPSRHHHGLPPTQVYDANTEPPFELRHLADNTLLLMPAWEAGEALGVKVVTVYPHNPQEGRPSIQGCYLFFDATNGTLKSVLDGPALTNKRTAATSALASHYLSRKDARTMFMIGTGALAPDLIRAHLSVRQLEKVLVWGRNREKAQRVVDQLSGLDEISATLEVVDTIAEGMAVADIVSCATNSPTPLVLGGQLRPGQHIDLVGAYKPDRRESDNAAILRSKVYLDTLSDGLQGSGDIVQPLKNWIISEDHIQGDLFSICGTAKYTRNNEDEITLFKSVGYALEDLVAAQYYYEKWDHSIHS